ncbi:hypothetical protein LTS18_006589, partial [Coniosporium uncinatum]
RNLDNQKFILQNELRTWSELKRRSASVSESTPSKQATHNTDHVPLRRWGGCANGCNHKHMNFPRRAKRQNTVDTLTAEAAQTVPSSEKEDHPIAVQEAKNLSANSTTNDTILEEMPTASPTTGKPNSNDTSNDASSEDEESDGPEAFDPNNPQNPNHLGVPPPYLYKLGRDAGGSRSGVGTPAEGNSDDSDYFAPPLANQSHRAALRERTRSRSRSLKGRKGTLTDRNGEASVPVATSSQRKKTESEWAVESGMGSGAFADRLGDDRAGIMSAEETDGPVKDGNVILGEVVDKMKERDRKSFKEVY